MTETLEAFLFYGFNLCPAHHRGSHTDWIAFRAWSGILASGGTGMDLETEEITGDLFPAQSG